MSSITASALYDKFREHTFVHLIDVRTPGEFKTEHAKEAVNLPLDLISRKTLDQSKLTESGEPIYVICQSGGRSRKAIEKLQAEGVQNLVNVEGGTSAWIAAQLPTIKSQGSISLERQVRIAAGAIVFITVVLGHFIHPGFLVISGLVGAGLVFAGISNFCGMGLLLARMPWNR